MDYQSSPFHRFYGWKILALIAVLVVYSLWYFGPGPYGQLEGLAPGMPMEAKFHYSGQEVVDVFAGLDANGRKTKLISLVFDLPVMFLNMLVFEALIAFGIRRMKLGGSWNLLFILPIAFLLCDFFEDSFLTLTLTSENTVLGTIAGLFTSLKTITFSLASLTGLLMALAGLWAFFRSK